MKRALLFTVLCMALSLGFAQQPSLPFFLELQEISISQAPAIQSFAAGTHNGRLIMMGGRISGLHGQSPFNSFPPDSANKFIWMVDPVSSQIWSTPVSALTPSIARQLEATNPCSRQKDNLLYLIGGYGYDVVSNQYDTWPYLLVVDLAVLHNALVAGTSVSAAFSQIQDSRMAVTGGQLGMHDSLFYLVGGQKFTGRYNPHGNPSYTQTYTDAIATFTLVNNGSGCAIQNYTQITDAQELHRRDYNMADQIFPDGSFGFTAFSGVFRPAIDLPWHNIVNISGLSYEAVSENTFSQLLNQYHGAKMSVYDASVNEMHTVFFGGIGMYDWDTLTNSPLVDSAVPFVSTISLVTRFADSSLTERVFPQRMPGLLGASAEFIHADGVSLVEGHVIDLIQLPPVPTEVGYIYGGIESNQPNVFMQTTGSSHATNRIFKVKISRPPFSSIELGELHHLKAFPNPASDICAIYLPWESRNLNGRLLNAMGQQIPIKYTIESGKVHIDTQSLSPGLYLFILSEGNQQGIARIVKN